MKLRDVVDESVQRWPISFLLEEYFVAARRYFARPDAPHRKELDFWRARVGTDLATNGPPRLRDRRTAWQIAAERHADARRAGTCLCWRCGAARRLRNTRTR